MKGRRIATLTLRDPVDLPWKDLGVELVFECTGAHTGRAEVNGILAEEAETERYAGVLGVSEDPLVSSDVIGDPRASIVDLELTKVVDGDLVKIMSWYDNEWGYANQMVREAISIGRARR